MQYTILASAANVVPGGWLYSLAKGTRIYSQTAVLEVTEPILLLASDREEASAFLHGVQTGIDLDFTSLTLSSVADADDIFAACGVDGLAGAADGQMGKNDPCCKWFQGECVICLEDLKESGSTPAICFPCGHSMCEKCFRELQRLTPYPPCPYCRNPIVSASLFLPELCISARQIYLSSTPQVQRKLKHHQWLDVENTRLLTIRNWMSADMLKFALMALLGSTTYINALTNTDQSARARRIYEDLTQEERLWLSDY